jgi:hypothetical protein
MRRAVLPLQRETNVSSVAQVVTVDARAPNDPRISRLRPSRGSDRTTASCMTARPDGRPDPGTFQLATLAVDGSSPPSSSRLTAWQRLAP